ncbi:ankyrin repeat domain-containing protein [Burkholderia orbicola]|uniref:ankyrin repeat domain-containing protein n=1 Tax=Burkholderia orbicola TaxID=2978683 RepID=UPI002FDF993A
MRTVSEIEEEMEQYQEEGNLGKVMDLVDELGNMQDRLYKAIAEGDLNEALYFDSLGFDLREATCLRVAAKYGQCKLIGYLIRNGADVHANGDEALCFAAEQGHLEAAQCLVELGADVHAQEEKPVKLATHTDKIGVVQYLVEAGASIDAVLEITGSGSFYPDLHQWAQSYKRKQKLEGELSQKDEPTPKTKI